MTSFASDMQKEKLAVILLVGIIIGALSTFLIVTYGSDISSNLFKENKPKKVPVVAWGDCIDVNYTIRYTNLTVIGSTYKDVINKTGGTPSNIFVSLNKTELPPDEYYYNGYSSDYINGLLEGLIGLKEGQEATIRISPDKAYGISKLVNGSVFYTISIDPELNQTYKVTNLTNENISLYWINVDNYNKFTMPMYILLEKITQETYVPFNFISPYWLWKNSSEIINITDEDVLIETTPTKNNSLCDEITPFYFGENIDVTTGEGLNFIFPDATTAEWNETTITLTSSPVVGTTYVYEGTAVIGIENVTDEKINISYIIADYGSFPLQMDRSIEFNRTYTIRRAYNNLSTFWAYNLLTGDLEKQGFGLHPLTGELLIYEVKIEKIYKTS